MAFYTFTHQQVALSAPLGAFQGSVPCSRTQQLTATEAGFEPPTRWSLKGGCGRSSKSETHNLCSSKDIKTTLTFISYLRRSSLQQTVPLLRFGATPEFIVLQYHTQTLRNEIDGSEVHSSQPQPCRQSLLPDRTETIDRLKSAHVSSAQDVGWREELTGPSAGGQHPTGVTLKHVVSMSTENGAKQSCNTISVRDCVAQQLRF